MNTDIDTDLGTDLDVVAGEDHAGLVGGQGQGHDRLALQHLSSLINEDVAEGPLEVHGGQVQCHLHRGHHHPMLAHHGGLGHLKSRAVLGEVAVLAHALWNRVQVALLRQNTQQQGLAAGALAKVCVQVFGHVQVCATVGNK